jgi:hypothetical protein
MTQKDNARRAIKLAVKHGRMVRPQNCSQCGRSGVTKDGRAFVHAHHHEGYDNPLDVIWLCARCHFTFDKRPSREANGRAKLTEQQVAEIKNRYRKGNRYYHQNSSGALAREYGVDRTTIQRIIAGTLWIDAALEGK